MRDADTSLSHASTSAAFVVRARLLRKANRLSEAESDIAAALKLAPILPGALYERALLARDRLDQDAARADLLAIIDADEASAMAELARRELEQLDLKSE